MAACVLRTIELPVKHGELPVKHGELPVKHGELPVNDGLRTARLGMAHGARACADRLARRMLPIFGTR